jgi:hypothetical protein
LNESAIETESSLMVTSSSEIDWKNSVSRSSIVSRVVLFATI